MRLRADAGEGRPPAEGRTLSGRVFDSDGSPIVGLRLYCSKDRTLVDCAADRLGVFRFKDLPPGEIQVQIRRDVQTRGIAIIPPEAAEVEVRLPKPVDRRGKTG